MNAAVKMVSSSVQMDITASSKVSYNRRKIDMLQGSIFFGESNFSSFVCIFQAHTRKNGPLCSGGYTLPFAYL